LYRKPEHTFYVVTFLSENPAVYQIMWKSKVEPGRPQMTV